MGIQFDVVAMDGEFKKDFASMDEAEAYFGPVLAYSNVSNDGVQKFYPANAETEQALEAYVNIVRDERNSPIAFAFPETLGVKPELLKAAERQEISSLGEHEWVVRTPDFVNMALATLCAGDNGQHGFGQCREDVFVVANKERTAVFIRDCAKTTNELSDLYNRPLVAVDSFHFKGVDINEDAGTSQEHSLAIFTGPRDIVTEEVGKLDDHLGGYSRVEPNAEPESMSMDALAGNILDDIYPSRRSPR